MIDALVSRHVANDKPVMDAVRFIRRLASACVYSLTFWPHAPVGSRVECLFSTSTAFNCSEAKFVLNLTVLKKHIPDAATSSRVVHHAWLCCKHVLDTGPKR